MFAYSILYYRKGKFWEYYILHHLKSGTFICSFNCISSKLLFHPLVMIHVAGDILLTLSYGVVEQFSMEPGPLAQLVHKD